jgi:predicted NAD-dependent protein-ADP-ribosyltransferase YbiA (DUF1768 family)
MQDSISVSPAPTFAAVPPDGRILYFARDRAAFGFLSHFHPSPIALDGETWPTVEHFYQAQKSDDPRKARGSVIDRSQIGTRFYCRARRKTSIGFAASLSKFV